MDRIQDLLQVSAKLYVQLADIPKGEERDHYVEEINSKLDNRGEIMESLRENGFEYDASNKAHVTLFELDKGIRERMRLVMNAVQYDLKELQNAKKNEQQYMNPYSHVQVMDGMYYDRKK